ncbi:MAG: glycosyltransferase [Ktedonobacterales bacterium]|nr:glycosyltransferase [Ktedonobacterales bacterium]
MGQRPGRGWGWLAWGLAAAFALDRALKLVAVERAFHRPAPVPPDEWPTVTLLQPITRGVPDLRANLAARARLAYPAPIQHLFICDAADAPAQAACQDLLVAHPTLNGQIITVTHPGAAIAPKIPKLSAGLPLATGTVLCLLDDDVAPRPDALQRLIPYLSLPAVGVVFGLPNNAGWHTLWSGMLSGFTNANMPLSFIALAALTEPFRITGHMAAYSRVAFVAVGGLAGLAQSIDDDFELGRRLHAHGYHTIQAPVVYDIVNDLPTARAYHRQLHRWFVLPRHAMLPHLTPRQRFISLAVSGPTLAIPGLVLAVALAHPRRATWAALGTVLGTFAATYALTQHRYLRGHTPWHGWLLLPAFAIATPLHALATLLLRSEIEWRGQRLRLCRDGTYEVMS